VRVALASKREGGRALLGAPFLYLQGEREKIVEV